jgi:glycosyltransferase involved in cell wall biosynthesis
VKPTLLVVTDQLPFPARNGITLPFVQHLQRLSSQHEIDLLYLCLQDQLPTTAQLDANRAICRNVIVHAMGRRSKIRRALAELGGREMFQHGWFSTTPLSLASVPQAILVGPMSAVARLRGIPCGDQLLGACHGRSVALVNDCTAAEYRHRGRGEPMGRASIKAMVDRLRAGGIGRIEATLLRPYSRVALQTPADRDLMCTLAAAWLRARISLLPNGVDRRLFAVEPVQQPRVLFVGELSGEYASTARWILDEAWPRVVEAHPSARLRIVGRGASAALRAAMARDASVEHLDFVDDLVTVYADAAIVVSPVWKGFGLINKSLEGMAAALPVVGGSAAFNGIDGFEAGRDGLTVERRDAGAFARAISMLMSQPERARELGLRGRELVRRSFDWDEGARHLGRLLADRDAADRA